MTYRRTRLDALAMGLMLLFSALWGFNQVAVKVANESISPLFQAGLRSFAASAMIWIWCGARGIPLLKRDGSLGPGLLAGLLFAAEFGLIYWGLEYTTASRGVLFLYTAPFVVAAGTHWLVPSERLRWAQIAGLVFAFAGVFAAFADDTLSSTRQQLIGDAMLLAAAIIWGATTVTVRASVLARINPAKTLLYQLGVSAIGLLVAAAIVGEPGFTNPSSLGLVSLAWQIVVVAFASYLGWFWLMSRYLATELSAFSFLTPLFGMAFGATLLGEHVGPLLLLALVCVALGLWLVNRQPRNVNTGV